MSKKKEVTVTQDTALATASQDLGAWGDNQLDSRDIVLPKILVMQPTSDLVAEGKAKMGDFVDSLSGEVIGNIEEAPLEITPFHMEKIYIVSKKSQGDTRFEFDRIEKVEQQNYPFEEQVADQIFKYEYTLQFYVLRAESPDLPYVLSFKSTSLKAGKVVSTQMFVRNRAAGLVPPAYSMIIGGKKITGDNKYVVMDAKSGNKSSPEMIGTCLEWFKVVQSGATKVSHEEPTAQAPANEATNF